MGRPNSDADGPGESRRLSTEDVLRVAGLRIGCAAIAVVAPNATIRKIWARGAADQDFAVAQIADAARELILGTIDRLAPVVSNRLRPAEHGAIAGKLITIPIIAESKKAVGVLVVVNQPSDPSFDAQAVRRAQRFARMIARNLQDNRDRATGLLNWNGFKRRLERILATTGSGSAMAVMYGNLDRLHLVNNTAGHATGDRVIRHAAVAIRRRLAGIRSIASRLSGDRFLVLLPNYDADAARGIADEIRVLFESESRRVFGKEHAISICWGVVATDATAVQIEQSIADAEVACRAAKDRGRNRVEVFQNSDASMIRRHDDLDAVRLLRDGLHSDRIVVFAQPIVPLLNTSLATSYELLIRMLDGDGAMLEPAAFMSAAQRYQMLPDLDRAMVQHAFRQLQAARRVAGRLPFCVSLNLTGPTISDPEFGEWLLGAMAEHAIPGAQLTIEITEAAAAANLPSIQSFIEQMARHGVRFALDDFGTGVNSLSHLKDLSISTIKLDGSYVRDVETNSRSESLVRALVQLAGSMNILTVAEYVESVSLRARLAKLGVQFAQGHAVGRAEPLRDVLAEHGCLDTSALSLAG